MKKQLLLLIVAFFAVTSAFGQAVSYSRPIPLTCTDDELHPIAGKEYLYEADADPYGGFFRWWATKDSTFISTTGTTTTYNYDNAAALLTVANTALTSTSTNYNVDAKGDSVSIIWSSATLAATKSNSPTFVAVRNMAADGCSDNFKAYPILPINGFTVDVKNLNPVSFDTIAYTGTNPEQCADIVRGATYDRNNGGMLYDYGQNYLYFEFVAANFTESWKPYFSVDSASVQDISYEYTYALPSTWSTTPPTWTTLTNGSTVITTNQTDTSKGVSVFVRVTVKHNNYENLNGQDLVLTLDGVNKEGQWDVVNDTCVDPNAKDENDKATQRISPRPAVTTPPSMPAPGLIPGNEVNI